MTATEDRYARGNRFAAVLAVTASAAALIMNSLSLSSTKAEVVEVKGASSSLAADTLACTDGAVPNSQACQAASQKAAQVQQTPAPITITVPRRTDAEIRDLIAETIRRNPDLIPRGPAGETPVIDYERIISAVQGRIVLPTPIPGPTGAAGTDGVSPVVDYAKIVTAVLAQIPAPKDGKDGINGTSPACITEARQCRGEDGPACPPGYSLTYGTDLLAQVDYVRCEKPSS